MESNGYPVPLIPMDDPIIDAQDGSGLATQQREESAYRPRNDSVTEYQNMAVSLIIPAKNEAANIAWVLEQIPECVDEVILVDGNSTDATLITARACRPDLRIVTQQGIGKGNAVRTGFLAATGDIIVMLDADGSMWPREIPHYLHFLTNGYDFVKGSRLSAAAGRWTSPGCGASVTGPYLKSSTLSMVLI